MQSKVGNVLLLCVVSLYSLAVQADLLDDSQQAFIQFQDLSHKASTAYQMPRLYTPEGSALLIKIANERILTDINWNEENMAQLVTTCEQAQFVELSYKLYGIKPKESKQHTFDAGSGFIEATDLEHEFQNEIAFLKKYQIKCTAGAMRLYAQYLAKLNGKQLGEEADGIAAYRENVEALIKEVISNLSDSVLHPSNRLDPIKLTVAEADVFASFLSSNSRRKVVGIAKVMQGKCDSVYKNQLSKLIDILSKSKCDRICRT